MTQVKTRWERRRTQDTRELENVLSKKFQQVNAYRYNSASIRVRIVDPRFEGKDFEKRDKLVDKELKELPAKTQADIIMLLLLTPAEKENPSQFSRTMLLNAEFEDPSPSML